MQTSLKEALETTNNEENEESHGRRAPRGGGLTFSHSAVPSNALAATSTSQPAIIFSLHRWLFLLATQNGPAISHL